LGSRKVFRILDIENSLTRSSPLMNSKSSPFSPDLGSIDKSIAALIDHTILKADATPHEIETVCAEAVQYGFASVCINPSFVPRCKHLLKGTSVKVCTVIGFPLGASSTASKSDETKHAIRDGAEEIDMVLHVGMLKSGNFDYVLDDIAAVVRVAHSQNAIVKVILETSLLNDDEKRTACRLAQEAGANFVKTSTGFSAGGATEHDIALMRNAVGSSMGVKASGGIRTREHAQAMIAAGATRIGASAGIKIVTGSSPSTSGSY
jgi:deoxyribose-phosphate aldolase